MKILIFWEKYHNMTTFRATLRELKKQKNLHLFVKGFIFGFTCLNENVFDTTSVVENLCFKAIAYIGTFQNLNDVQRVISWSIGI